MAEAPLGEWFNAADPGQILGCGLRDQNRADAAALLAALADRRAIHAGAQGIRNHQPGAWVFCQSSGSSGQSKTIRRRQASWIASFNVNRTRFDITGQDRYAVLGHLGHSLSLYAATEALHLGASLLILSADSPRHQLQQLAALEVSVIYATPTQLKRLQFAAAGVLLPHVRLVICGGGRMDSACQIATTALCPNAAIREFYGASETSFVTIADPDTPPGSVGKAYPGVRLKLDGQGVVWVDSPYLFDGYAEPELPPVARDGSFISVGDVGHLDNDGNLFLRGRVSRMVTIADRNLFLEDVEAVLAEQGLPTAVAVAVPDATRGHALLVVVQSAADDALAAHLRRCCRDALGDHAAPRWVRFVDELPVLPSGKPDLAALSAIFAPQP